MPQAVHTRNKRFEWVEKELADVGDFTEYPMEITGASFSEKIDKIAELFHRVKDSQFTSGNINFNGGGSFDLSIFPNTENPENRALEDEGVIGMQTRGYTSIDDGLTSIPPEKLPYFGSAYDSGEGASYRDISDKERAIHLSGQGGALPQWNTPSESVTAFTFRNEAQSIGSDLTIWFRAYESEGDVWLGAYGESSFGNEIAYVKENPEDTIYTASTRFFVKFRFECFNFGLLAFGASTYYLSEDVTELTNICNYVVRMATGDLVAKIYAFNDAEHSSTDLIHEAVEWWPYQDNGGNVWNPATGEPA